MKPVRLTSSTGLLRLGWWAKLDAAGCRIIARFRSSTPLAVTSERAVPEDGTVLSDSVGTLPARQAKNRRNPFSKPSAKFGSRSPAAAVRL